jgi:hypothetical protein
MSSNKKRKLDIPTLDGLDEAQVVALRDSLLSSDTQDVRELLGYLMSSTGILRIILSQEELPSFSSATWAKVCTDFGLYENKGLGQLAFFDVPDLCLPPSVHHRVLMAAMRAMDVYREPQHHGNEAAHVRLFEAVSQVSDLMCDVGDTSQWHVPLCQLFRGRIVDKPEERLPRTTLTSGGFVEHELFVLDQGLILLVYELKFQLHGPMGHEEAAQVFLEMHGSYSLFILMPFILF